MKFTFHYFADGSCQTVELDETSVFTPYFNYTFENPDQEESNFNNLLASIAQHLAEVFYRGTKENNHYVITEIKPDPKNPNGFSIFYKQGFDSPAPQYVDVTTPYRFNTKNIEIDSTSSATTSATIYAQPRWNKLIETYRRDRAKAINEAVNKRKEETIRPLKEKVRKLNAAIDHYRAEAAIIGDADYCQFIEDQVSVLDLQNFNKTFTEEIEKEERRLNTVAAKELDHKIEASSQLRFFNRLLAYFLWEAARKYWEEGANKNSFNEKFKELQIRIIDGALSPIQETYNVFELLTLQQSQSLIQRLLQSVDSRKIPAIPLGSALGALGGWANGLKHIHHALEQFQEACFVDPAFSTPKKEVKEQFFSKPLITKIDSTSSNVIDNVFNKTDFSWSQNAYDYLNEQIENNNPQIVTLNDNATVADKLYQPVVERINGPSLSNLKNLVKRKSKRFYNTTQGYDEGQHKQFKAIKSEIEKRRDLVLLKRLKESAVITLQSANAAINRILPRDLMFDLKKPRRVGQLAGEELWQSLHACNQRAIVHFNNIKKLYENSIAAMSMPTELSSSMGLELLKLQLLEKEALIQQEALALVDNADAFILANESVSNANVIKRYKEIIYKIAANTDESKQLAHLVESLKELAEFIKTKKDEEPQITTTLMPINLSHSDEIQELPSCRNSQNEPAIGNNIDDCNFLVNIITNLAYWNHRIHFSLFKAGTKIEYQGETKLVLSGIAEMIEVIKSQDESYKYDERAAAQLIDALVEKGQKANERTAYRSFVHVRSKKAQQFYNALANRDIEALERWNQTVGPLSKVGKEKPWFACMSA